MREVLQTTLPTDATMDTVGEWDSIAHLSIVMGLEEEFDIQFATHEMMEITSVPLIVEAVKGLAR